MAPVERWPSLSHWLARWWPGGSPVRTLDALAEDYATTLAEEEFGPGFDIALEQVSACAARVRVPRLAGALANEAHLQFGLLKPTEANKAMVRRWIANLVRDKRSSLRTRDALAAIPIAVLWTFVPRLGDIAARELAYTQEVGERVRAEAARYNGRSWSEYMLWCMARVGHRAEPGLQFTRT